MEFTGSGRIGGLGSDARVTDGATGMDVPESVYRARGYQPTFDKHPWKDKYDAGSEAGTRGKGAGEA